MLTLRTRIRLTADALRFGGGIGLFMLAANSPASPLLVVLGIGWLLFCGPILRQVILPPLFPETTCPGCRRTIPLVYRGEYGRFC